MDVSSGFWDTYRRHGRCTRSSTRRDGPVINGFVQQYKEERRDRTMVYPWPDPRRECPGPARMSSIAERVRKGVTNFDLAAAYDAALKDATATATAKVSEASSFLGDATPTLASVGRLELTRDAISDFGIANMAKGVV